MLPPPAPVHSEHRTPWNCLLPLAGHSAFEPLRQMKGCHRRAQTTMVSSAELPAGGVCCKGRPCRTLGRIGCCPVAPSPKCFTVCARVNMPTAGEWAAWYRGEGVGGYDRSKRMIMMMRWPAAPGSRCCCCCCQGGAALLCARCALPATTRSTAATPSSWPAPR